MVSQISNRRDEEKITISCQFVESYRPAMNVIILNWETRTN